MNTGGSKPLIEALHIQNLLSFGADTKTIPLHNLNVIIGANGSGKSNFIEVISLLQATPKDLPAPIRKGGGIQEWLWKGIDPATANIEVLTQYPKHNRALRYALSFTQVAQRFELTDECIENKKSDKGQQRAYFYYKYDNNHPVLNVNREQRKLQRDSVDPEQSILSQRKDPDQYPELTWLGEQFGKIKIFREWAFGRSVFLRKPQKIDAPNHFLLEDCSNLGLVLNTFKRHPAVKRKILSLLRDFYADIEDFDVIVEGGSVQLFLQEGDFVIPATRLSDGTLRYICLLAILCHPNPPPLICIEEPELGLHPDIIPTIAELLIDASTRTQLIVTTHCELLIDEFTASPESVLICEKHNGSSVLTRLSTENLSIWLEKYSLGTLWRKGEIGGNRW